MESFSLAQLVGLAPTLLVEMGGMALALIYWRRWPGPSMLLFCGTGLMFIVSLARAFLIPSMVRAQMNQGGNMAQVGMVMSLIGLGSSLVNALGLGLVLAAVFVGRREKWDRLD